MKLKIGFRGYEKEENTNMQVTEPVVAAPVKSVVQVRFPSDGRSFAYYNDGFDLKVGDVVFVEGKFEGLQGIVTEVSHSFRIKLSDYKRVIAKADTHVSGALYFGGSHLIVFDDTVIPYDKIRGWFFAPEDDGEVAVGYGDESFLLENLGKFKIRPEIADRGFDYYNCNKVIYISLCGEKGIKYSIAWNVCIIKKCVAVSCSTNGAIVGIIMMVCNTIIFATSFVCRCVICVFISTCFPYTMNRINIATVLIMNNKIQAK